MTATNPADRQTVRTLLRQSLPSGFPNPPRPLVVADVAAALRRLYAIDQLRIPTEDVEANTRLLAVETIVVDGRMTGRRVREIAEATGIAASEYYWERFRREAITMLMARGSGPAVMIACERQE